MLSRFSRVVFLLVAGTSLGYSELVPVSLSGWNQDVIAENTAVNPLTGTTSDAGAGWVWYESGAPNAPGGSPGLPVSGSFVSAVNAAVTFQFQNYTAENVLFGGSASTATLTAAGTNAYTSLAFLTSCQGSCGFAPTLHFADGSTQALGSTSDPDWTSGGQSNVALAHAGLLLRSTSWSGYYSGTLNMYEHDFTVAAIDQSKAVTSISFALTGNEMIFAVSGAQGAVAAAPEPSTFCFLAGGLAVLLLVRFREAA